MLIFEQSLSAQTANIFKNKNILLLRRHEVVKMIKIISYLVILSSFPAQI